MLTNKERQEIHFSEKSLEALRRMAEHGEETERQFKEATPECPDGSGEIGRYDEVASEHWGVPIYSTNSGKYYRLSGKSVIPNDLVPDRLKK